MYLLVYLLLLIHSFFLITIDYQFCSSNDLRFNFLHRFSVAVAIQHGYFYFIYVHTMYIYVHVYIIYFVYAWIVTNCSRCCCYCCSMIAIIAKCLPFHGYLHFFAILFAIFAAIFAPHFLTVTIACDFFLYIYIYLVYWVYSY